MRLAVLATLLLVARQPLAILSLLSSPFGHCFNSLGSWWLFAFKDLTNSAWARHDYFLLRSCLRTAACIGVFALSDLRAISHLLVVEVFIILSVIYNVNSEFPPLPTTPRGNTLKARLYRSRSDSFAGIE